MNYLITFRCCGTWLHGDERGSVDLEHNHFNEPLIEPNARMEFRRRLESKSPPITLGSKQRDCVESAMRDVALHREWQILALSVLANHVHIVVATGESTSPQKVVIDFKAWSTRRLREQNLASPEAQIWAEHGSTRYLWDEKAIMAAVHYVQEQETPKTDRDA